MYDHLIRIGEMIDTYRDLLSGAMDVYLSTVSNRLNGVMKQLAIIATVFMPLTFLTGFFGQNLGWMVLHTGGLGHFTFELGLGHGKAPWKGKVTSKKQKMARRTGRHDGPEES